MQGLETLGLRMERHCDNALVLAKFLESHEQVDWVNYGALPNDKYNDVCKKITNGQASGIVSFGIKGGGEAGAKFIDNLKLLYHVANIGDSRSLAIHPASTTHSQLSPKEQLSAGVTPGYVRLSIGIENIEDILADIDQAINKAS